MHVFLSGLSVGWLSDAPLRGGTLRPRVEAVSEKESGKERGNGCSSGGARERPLP
jgi:hypothetical protein